MSCLLVLLSGLHGVPSSRKRKIPSSGCAVLLVLRAHVVIKCEVRDPLLVVPCTSLYWARGATVG